MAKIKEVFIEKHECERIRIGINEYEGKEYIDIRQFFQIEEGEWRPTKKGFTLPLDKLAELKEAIEQLDS